MMYLRENSKSLHSAQIMTREYKRLMEQQHVTWFVEQN